MVRCVDAPVFIFRGEQTNIVRGIVELFKRAREAGHSVVVIDELDLLINQDSRVIRALQESLDGVESSDDILVVSATNNPQDIPSALLRCGRLEKLIRIPNPNGEEALELFKKYIKDFNVTLPTDFDDEEIALSLNMIDCASIKSIVNDLVLRNGFDNITVDMIYASIYNITDRIKDSPKESNYEVAVHEAAHAVMTSAYPEYFTVNRINISGASGEFHAKEVVEDFWPFDKVKADIKISMAGIVAQKVICKGGSRGSQYDLQKARVCAYNLFTQSGYSSCWETLPVVSEQSRMETQVKRRKMERKIEAFLRKCEKEVIKFIKEHKEQIIKLGSLLFEKKHLKSSEILSCIN